MAALVEFVCERTRLINALVYRKVGRCVRHLWIGVAACLVAAGLSFGRAAHAGEWPQILGLQRNGIAVDEEIRRRLPAKAPKVVWQRDVGSGYAGVAVTEGRVVLFHRLQDQEVAEALLAKTGKPIWKQSFPVVYESAIAPDDGPRCVPVIHEGRVYLCGVSGNLYCLDLKDGAKRWSHELAKEYTIPPSYFGAGSTPLVEDDLLLVNVGARGAGVVAFKLDDGSVAWKSTDEGASYSSPVAATVDGVRHAIFVTRLNCVSLDPRNGEVRFRFPFGQRGPTVNAATPLVIDGHLFLSASYGVGAVWARIGKSSAEKVWRSDDVMSSQYTTCVYKDGALFGIDGRQDLGVARLRCFDPVTRKIHWTEEGFGTGNLILAGDKLVIMKTDGELILAEASKKGYRELAKAQVLDGTAQPLPALADGFLFVRDEKVLKCVDLR